MIDWLGLAASSLWVLGLALGLAAASFACWTSSGQKGAGPPSRTSWRVRAAFDVAGVLFSVGWAASSVEAWERLGWGLMGIALAIQSRRDWRSRGAGSRLDSPNS
jgi:hypothetical protein